MRRWRGSSSARSTGCSSSPLSPPHPPAPTPPAASSSSNGRFILGMRCCKACNRSWMICSTR
uniref:Uncharacterized protein n=1 Tax=Arundo donax TaxID=35708 RepID=A0A0A9GAQ5_ARUDO